MLELPFPRSLTCLYIQIVSAEFTGPDTHSMLVSESLIINECDIKYIHSIPFLNVWYVDWSDQRGK